MLKVKFVPLCATDKMMVVGATKGEDIQLTCEVKSYPMPKRFYWKFENSEESLEIDKQKFNNNGTRSVLSFSTATDHVREEIIMSSSQCLIVIFHRTTAVSRVGRRMRLASNPSPVYFN